MAEQQRDQLGAEARERQRLAALDDQLDDVAREHEQERRQHREVGGRERVEHELAEEVGREPRRAVGDRDERDQHADEHARCRRESASGCHGTGDGAAAESGRG